MSKGNRDHQAVTNDSFLNIVVPSNSIDLFKILMNLRDELLVTRLRFSNNFNLKGTDVVVPSIKSSFDIWYENDNLYFRTFNTKKKYKIPCEFESDQISETSIEVIYRLINHLKINQP